MHRVLYNYSPDEGVDGVSGLLLQEGDHVAVLREVDDSWAKVQIARPNGRVGVVPRSYLKEEGGVYPLYVAKTLVCLPDGEEYAAMGEKVELLCKLSDCELLVRHSDSKATTTVSAKDFLPVTLDSDTDGYSPITSDVRERSFSNRFVIDKNSIKRQTAEKTHSRRSVFDFGPTPSVRGQEDTNGHDDASLTSDLPPPDIESQQNSPPLKQKKRLSKLRRSFRGKSGDKKEPKGGEKSDKEERKEITRELDTMISTLKAAKSTRQKNEIKDLLVTLNKLKVDVAKGKNLQKARMYVNKETASSAVSNPGAQCAKRTQSNGLESNMHRSTPNGVKPSQSEPSFVSQSARRDILRSAGSQDSSESPAPSSVSEGAGSVAASSLDAERCSQPSPCSSAQPSPLPATPSPTSSRTHTTPLTSSVGKPARPNHKPPCPPPLALVSQSSAVPPRKPASDTTLRSSLPDRSSASPKPPKPDRRSAGSLELARQEHIQNASPCGFADVSGQTSASQGEVRHGVRRPLTGLYAHLGMSSRSGRLIKTGRFNSFLARIASKVMASADDQSPKEVARRLVEDIRVKTGSSFGNSCLSAKTVVGHLKDYMPQQTSELEDLEDALQQLEESTDGGAGSQDAHRLDVIFTELTTMRNDGQQRNWQVHDDEAIISEYLDELLTILADADQSLCAAKVAGDGYAILTTLTEYYQMETRVPIRLKLLKLFGGLCSLDSKIPSILLNTNLPLELARDIKADVSEYQKALYSCLVATMMFSCGEKLPLHYYDTWDGEFIQFLLDLVENPCEEDEDERLMDCAIGVILGFNYHLSDIDVASNTVMKSLQAVASTKNFCEKVLLIVNREEDPVSLGEPLVPDSVLKLLKDMFADRATASLFYTSDTHVLVGIVARQLNDLPEESELRYHYLLLLEEMVQTTDFNVDQYGKDELSTALTRIEEGEVVEDRNRDTITRIRSLAPCLASS